MNSKTWIAIWALFGLFTSVYGQAVNNAQPSQTPSDNSLDLTDEERYLSQTYTDEIGAQQQKKEECAKLGDPNACQGMKVKTKFMGIDSDIVKMAAKMYSLVVPMLGMNGIGDFTRADKPLIGGKDESANPEEANAPEKGESNTEQKEKKMKDYCQYIAVATEVIAQFQQQSAQQHLSQLPENQSTRQKEALYKAARSHKERAKNHKMQAYGWGATTACYVYYVTQAYTDWKVYAKMGASGFLAAFFANEAKAHQSYYEEVRKIADDLPGPGDCNPVTQPDCFCSKPKLSAGDVPLYQKYCQPYLHKKAIAQTSYRVPCVDQDLRADPKCTCLDEDSCFDKKYFTDVKLPPFGSFLKSPEASSIRSLTRGELTGGSVAGGSVGLGAKAKKILNHGIAGKKIPGQRNLNPQQAREAQIAKSLGLPKALAALVASQPFTSASQKSLAKLRSATISGRKLAAKSNRVKDQVWRFNQASGLNKGKKKKGKDPYDFINRFKKKKKKAIKRGQVIKFAEQASKSAQVHRNKETALFDIISHRYKISGWRRLEVSP